MDLKFNSYQPSFQALKPIPRLAQNIGGEALQEALPELGEMADDVDIEIIPKKGFISKVRSLNFFVTDIGQSTGRWVSLSVDPKGYIAHMNNTNHYISVDSFTKENIIEAAQRAKDANQKEGFKFDRKSIAAMPADAVIIAKWMYDREQKKTTES